jgi:hypothetical protein
MFITVLTTALHQLISRDRWNQFTPSHIHYILKTELPRLQVKLGLCVNVFLQSVHHHNIMTVNISFGNMRSIVNQIPQWSAITTKLKDKYDALQTTAMFRIFFEHVLSQICITSGGSVAPPQKYVRLPCYYHMVLNWKIHRSVGLCFQVAWQPIKTYNSIFYTTHITNDSHVSHIFRTRSITDMYNKWRQCRSTPEVRTAPMLLSHGIELKNTQVCRPMFSCGMATN